MYSKPFSIGLACLMTLFVITPIAHAQAKITGPWLWMIAPTALGQGGVDSINVDSLAVASGGTVTEADVAVNGANAGDRVGNFVWTLGQISATGSDNINDCINRIGLAAGNVDDHSSYALFTLESDTVRRDAMMRVGSDDAIKVWLNGEVVHNNPVDRGASDFQDAFRVDLLAGDNLLMVKVSERGGDWSMFVGIDSGGNTEDQGTGTTDLNVGEPYTVRLIYFLPSDRQSKPDIDTKMDTLIKRVQQDYADDMEYHRFGRKTFRIETDATGKAVVHHVAGQFTAEYYEWGTFGKVRGEIEEQFDTQKNIYLVVVDSGYLIEGYPGIATPGSGAGGVAFINNIGNLAGYVYLASHELRHTFGLSHDFRIDGRGFTPQISKCTAELLDVHRYFNASRQGQDFLRNTTVEMLPPSLAPPPNTSLLRFEVTDPDGLHQAQLLTPEVGVAGERDGGFIACKRLNGTSSTVEFVTTKLTLRNKFVYLRIIDVHGNISWSQSYPIDVTSLLPPLQVVSIPDANLAAAVRETIGRSLTTHTMLNLIELDASNRQITDLTGLEHTHSLKALNLGGEHIDGEGYVNSNAVSNLSPLLGLTQLTYLNLRGNSLSDVSALAGLTQLTSLNLTSTSISDVSALSGLTQLRRLYLSNNSITDVSALAGLTQLRRLHLGGNSITDVSALAGLTQLTYLNLRGNSLSDVSALAGLTQLKDLYLSNNSITDVSALAGLTQLTSLNLTSTSISDVSALAGLTQLTWLSLGGTSITDVSALAGLTQLTLLDLTSTSITNVSALAGLTQLTYLYLSYNAISDVSALSGLTQLTLLDLRGNSLSDVSALAGLTQLTYLNLSNNAISDVSALSGLTQLPSLYLWGNAISDVSPLLGLNLTGTSWDSTGLYLERNPLSYASIHTHVPALQAKGIEVKFDNRTHPALLKISGDNQKGVSFAPLSHPFVVEVQDENGAALPGISVTFAVTAGGGTLSVTSTTTDEKGRAESTLTLGPNQGTHTVSVSAAGISSTVTFHAVYDTVPTEYFLSVPGGISLIHVPLKVIAVDGVAKPIESVADLYDALGGAATVYLLGTHDPATQRWFSYSGASDKGTSDDPPLTDDKGIIAAMKAPVAVRLRGDALGTNGHISLTLYPGFNLVGVPLRDSRINRVSDLFGLEGIGGKVSAITVSDNGEFLTLGQAGDEGDIPITGGQSFFLRAQEATTVAISGSGWYNTSALVAAPSLAIRGIEVGDATPILALRGSIVSPVGGWGRMPHLQSGSGFRVVVKNLSTGSAASTERGSAFPTVTGDEKEGYRLTVVDVETGRAATIGDILEISVRSPSPLIRVEPLRYIVTTEDVKRSRIELPALVAYEIPSETELLANYPNPFNPETWIPYRLAADAFVTLTIYDGSGRVVRTLDVGHRIAAVYESRSKAAYWDGRNEVGEQVASGLYFYTLTAGNFSATRRMVVVK